MAKKEEEQAASFYKGEIIFNEKDKPEFAYLIKRGLVTIFRTVEGKKEVQRQAKVGDIIGEVEIISGGRRLFGAEAEEYCSLIKIERKAILLIYKESPPLVKTLIEQLSGRVKDQEKTVQLLKKKEKIADHFIAMGKGVPAEDGSYFMKKTFHVGETIYKEGESGNCAYRIKKGSVELYKYDQDHNSLIETLREGSMLGELETVGGGARIHTAKAKELCELERIDRPTLKNLLKESDPIIRDLSKKIIQKLINVEEKTALNKLFSSAFMGFCTYLHLHATLGDKSLQDDDEPVVKVKGRAIKHQEKISTKVTVTKIESQIKDIISKLKAMKLIEIVTSKDSDDDDESDNKSEITISILDTKNFLKKAQKAYDKYVESGSLKAED